MIQPFDEILPVVLHPDSTKVLPDRPLHLIEIFGNKGELVRPSMEKERLENDNIAKPANIGNGVHMICHS